MKRFKKYLIETNQPDYSDPEFQNLNDELAAHLENHYKIMPMRQKPEFSVNRDDGVRTYTWGSWHNAIGSLAHSIVAHHLAEGTFTITPVTQKPVAVKLWTATNPVARDFREISDILWSATVLEENAQGAYTEVVEKPPAGGYTAFYVELAYQDGERGAPAYSLATPITILGN